MKLLRVDRCLTCALALCAACLRSAQAQTVRGKVVGSDETPVSGVIVQLVGDSSRVAARGLTDNRGEFQVTAVAGTYRIRTLRIGFRPTESEPVTLQAGSDVVRRIVLSGLPIGLDTVRVAGRNACRALNDSGAAFAVWEQIHAAASAVSLTAAARQLFTTTIAYERTLEADGRRVRTQTSSIHSGYVRAPWGGRSPEALHAAGYVVTDRDNVTTYYAPGLEVLLAPSFVEDHCFHLRLDSNRLGLEFEPNAERRKSPEIRGVLWLDAKTAELKALEFRYSNVLPEQDAVARGDASFIHLSNGMWAISEWSIRMPVLEQVAAPEVHGGSGVSVRQGEIRVQVAAVRVSGGELSLVREGADTLWTRSVVPLSGVVVDSTSDKPIAGARLSLVGTNLGDSTDSRGRFSIARVLPGEYTLEVRTPSLDSVNALHTVPVAFIDSTVPIKLRVPNATQLVSLVCGDRKLAESGIVLGTVTSATDSAPPRNVKVTAAWTETFAPVRDQPVPEGSSRKQLLDTRTDAHGIFRFCGLPIGQAISLTAGDGSGGGPVFVRIPPNGRFSRASLTLDPGARTALGAFVGTVTDSAGQPLVTADVSFPALSKRTVTDGSGAFRIEGVPAGIQRVLVRRLGYRAIDTSLAFSADRTVQRRFELVHAVTLDSVIVTESMVDKRMWSFEENRRVGLGHFLTRADLAKLENGPSTSSILQSFSGVGFVRGRGGRSWLTSPHGTHMIAPGSPDAVRACYAQVYLDNLEIYTGRDGEPNFDVNSIPPAEIEAIEYYASPAQTPARYSGLNSTCGVLVIWTLRYHQKDTTSASRRPPAR